MKKKISYLIGILIMAMNLKAQEPVVQETLEKLLESVGENLTEDTDIQEIQEDLEKYRKSPIDINSATLEELMNLHLISELQANQLVLYRKKTGPIFSLYEMTAIDGFTPDILLKVEPFICFDSTKSNIAGKLSSGELFTKSTRSFSNATPAESKNEGSPERYYLRFKYSHTNYQYGLVAEKDPGEAFVRQSNKHGFDYTSAFANFRPGNKGLLLFVGDYHVRFGQGLVAWQGFSMGKSAETTQIFRFSTKGLSHTRQPMRTNFFVDLQDK